MANWQAEILTEWVNDAEGNHPRILNDYSVISAVDTVGQPAINIIPDPNQCIWKIVCTEAVLDDVEGDANYAVLWSEKIVPEGI